VLRADDYLNLASLGVDRISIMLPLATDITVATKDRILLLVGHSAAGKSAALTYLSLDRSQRDMDVYCQQHHLPHTLDVLLEMATALTDSRIIVASNDSAFLGTLASSRRDGRFAQFLIVYLRRPPEMVYSHLSLENTDGQFHRPMPFSEYKVLYESHHRLYARSCDVEINYNGSTIPNLARIIGACLSSFVGENMKYPPGHPGHSSSSSGIDPPSGGSASTTKGEDFPEYFELLKLAEANGKQFISLTPPEMSRITAGGYQSFDSAIFPPKPAVNSISASKWRDLKWEKSDFVGKTTLELGCQLGFFSFNAAALGATECVGMDLNKRFVSEANKMAINYKKFICGWPDDRVRFVTNKIAVGDKVPFIADIIIANSILHWWIIQDESLTIRDILKWLHSMCRYGVYFEGCVSASEEIMKSNNVSMERFNEALFINSCEEVFDEVKYVGRCSYNSERIVLRLLK
jgi:SAM-dependent methyltransferase